MAENAKVITIPYKGKTYTLEFSRDVVRMMENQGFNIDNIDTKPVTTIPDLFAGAFRKNHASVSRKTINDIFDHMTRRDKLITKLAEMYYETVEALFDEPEEGEEGNANWDATW